MLIYLLRRILVAAVVDAELREVEALVEEVDVPEGVNVQQNFNEGFQCHLNFI